MKFSKASSCITWKQRRCRSPGSQEAGTSDLSWDCSLKFLHLNAHLEDACGLSLPTYSYAILQWWRIEHSCVKNCFPRSFSVAFLIGKHPQKLMQLCILSDGKTKVVHSTGNSYPAMAFASCSIIIVFSITSIANSSKFSLCNHVSANTHKHRAAA